MTKDKIVKGFDLTKVIKKQHEGKWLALSLDYKKIIGFADKVRDLEKNVGTENVIYMRAPRSDVGYCL